MSQFVPFYCCEINHYAIGERSNQTLLVSPNTYTDPFDRTSPPIPIGPHWMIIWPFDPKAAGLPAVMRGPGLY